VIGAISGVVGLLISYHHATAAGATMALCTVVVFFAALVARSLAILVRRRHAATLST
jgi:ABC-type Mn2+/Zn2+ transport system permease subunit